MHGTRFFGARTPGHLLSPTEVSNPLARGPTEANALIMIRRLKSGGYRLYSRKVNAKTGKRRNLGTFRSLTAAQRHEREVQFFKRHH
jgi:hypothetical protein